jgi:hypothetical protein
MRAPNMSHPYNPTGEVHRTCSHQVSKLRGPLLCYIGTIWVTREKSEPGEKAAAREVRFASAFLSVRAQQHGRQ